MHLNTSPAQCETRFNKYNSFEHHSIFCKTRRTAKTLWFPLFSNIYNIEDMNALQVQNHRTECWECDVTHDENSWNQTLVSDDLAIENSHASLVILTVYNQTT